MLHTVVPSRTYDIAATRSPLRTDGAHGAHYLIHRIVPSRVLLSEYGENKHSRQVGRGARAAPAAQNSRRSRRSATPVRCGTCGDSRGHGRLRVVSLLLEYQNTEVTFVLRKERSPALDPGP